VSAQSCAEPVDEQSHGVDGEASCGDVHRHLGEMQRCKLEQPVAVVRDDILWRGGRELLGELAKLFLGRFAFDGAAVSLGCVVPRRAGRGRAGRRTATARFVRRPLGGARLVRSGDLVLSTRCPKAAHGC
jgi:hypothetical protein